VSSKHPFKKFELVFSIGRAACQASVIAAAIAHFKPDGDVCDLIGGSVPS
jgi:hypothetical protein